MLNRQGVLSIILVFLSVSIPGIIGAFYLSSSKLKNEINEERRVIREYLNNYFRGSRVFESVKYLDPEFEVIDMDYIFKSDAERIAREALDAMNRVVGRKTRADIRKGFMGDKIKYYFELVDHRGVAIDGMRSVSVFQEGDGFVVRKVWLKDVGITREYYDVNSYLFLGAEPGKEILRKVYDKVMSNYISDMPSAKKSDADKNLDDILSINDQLTLLRIQRDPMSNDEIIESYDQRKYLYNTSFICYLTDAREHYSVRELDHKVRRAERNYFISYSVISIAFAVFLSVLLRLLFFRNR